MMRTIFSLFLIFLLVSFARSQAIQRPKLVVGIVIDQMRWDYLYRYYDRYTPDGFKRLINNGFSCENTLIPYTPTYTGPGHSCIYTGSVPSLHGIIANNWYDREQKKIVYCADDNSAETVGSVSSAGKMSPHNLWSNTISDEIRLACNFRNKTIAIALKDRGAILPGGHTANAAYWFDNATGGWISSTFYMKDLPDWVKKLNSKKLPDTYLKLNWNTLYPSTSYKQSTEDNEVYENTIAGSNVFPHITDTVSRNKYELFRGTPYGNSYTVDMAEAAIENEHLGKGDQTDMLALSFSSTDYVGHTFGPNSIEAEDVYLRLDRDLGKFLKYLDAAIGKGQYLLFLTADHGAAHVPAFAAMHQIPGGALDDGTVKRQINEQLKKQFNVSNLVLQVMNYEVYLDDAAIAENHLNKELIVSNVITVLMQYPGIARAFDLSHLEDVPLPATLKNMFANGYNQKLSGDIQFVFKPQWFDGGDKGTTHGTWNPYDSHIPLLWFGWNVKPGKTNREVYMTDIAPTVAALLHVQMPNACIGKVIEEVVR